MHGRGIKLAQQRQFTASTFTAAVLVLVHSFCRSHAHDSSYRDRTFAWQHSDHCRSITSWEAVELPTKLTVGYAVRAIDMNRDKKLDIAIVDSKRVLWLENPSWKEHVIYSTPDAKADNVCFAPLDIDGDGLLDLALGADWQPNNTDSGGSIGWLQQIGQGEWKYHPLASEPTTHRMNWMELVRDRPSLIVAPLKGPNSRAPGFEQTGVKLLALTPDRTAATASWDLRVLTDQLHVMHNFQVTDLDQDGQPDLVCASYEGATWLQFDEGGAARRITRIGTGQEQTPPARGASEIRVGHLANKRPFVATIEPWHGDKVVVYVAPRIGMRNSRARRLGRVMSSMMNWPGVMPWRVAISTMMPRMRSSSVFATTSPIRIGVACGFTMSHPTKGTSGLAR